MFSRLTILHWIISWGLFPGEDHFSNSQHSLVACSSLSRVKASWVPPVHFGCLLVSSLFSSCLGSNDGETSWEWFPTFLEDTLTAKFPVLWLLQSFCPFFHDPWVLGIRDVLDRNHFELGSTTLRFYWLWFSFVVYTCFKDKFFF